MSGCVLRYPVLHGVIIHMQDSVPAALTKDKKRIREQEIGVNLAWKSTLYVTNFPERTDDRAIKALFGKVANNLIFVLSVLTQYA